MRFRLPLLAALLCTALLLPGAGTASAQRQYVDPFAASTYCKALPKRQVRGMRGTPFRVCVRAIRAMKRDRRLSARRACRFESRRRVVRIRGRRHSPYGLCISAGRRLRRDQR